ncbi:hypothetical protein KY359_04905 [Candidatus Woesearchaeota archaeon]|nr:hypothetical protein [Candidatus Woesearchaeota archaeon]
MNIDCVICRYGELALKGKNRSLFENRLVSNIRDCLKKKGIDADVRKIRGRIFVHTTNKAATRCLKNIFGLVSLSPAVVSKSLPKSIEQKLIDYVKEVTSKNVFHTFRITTRRGDKSFSKTSNEMNVLLGDAVPENLGMNVDLVKPDLNLGVEIYDNTYIFHETIQCFGGLPVGMSGRVACIVKKESDLAAAWLMMKRGCEAFILLFDNIDLSLLTAYSYGSEIKSSRIDSLIDINGFAEENECIAVVTGDRLEEFDPESYKDINIPLLTPLIAYNEKMLSDLTVRIR